MVKVMEPKYGNVRDVVNGVNNCKGHFGVRCFSKTQATAINGVNMDTAYLENHWLSLSHPKRFLFPSNNLRGIVSHHHPKTYCNGVFQDLGKIGEDYTIKIN